MAKKKAVRRSGTRAVQAKTRGVPTLEEVHDCREELKFPEYIVLEVDTEDYDPEDYEEEDMNAYWRDCTCIRGMYKTEEEAVEECKKHASSRYNTSEYKIVKLHKNVKAIKSEPVIEVY